MGNGTRRLLIILPFLVSYYSHGQNGAIKELTLQDIINFAIERSLDAKEASISKNTSYWRWKAFQTNFRPQLILSAGLPNYNRSNIPVIQPDGTTKFRSISTINSDLSLSLSQNIGLTGGSIFINSNIAEIRNFNPDYFQYNSSPLLIGFDQPLFKYNSLKWEKKLEALMFNESKIKYSEDRTLIAYKACELFFDLLISQLNLERARANLANNDTIRKIAELKLKMGKISKYELLQIELAVLNSKKEVALEGVNLETTHQQLRSYIGLDFNVPLQLATPDSLPKVEIPVEQALQEAKANRSIPVTLKRLHLEAERQISEAKGASGVQVNLYGAFGLTGVGSKLKESYAFPQDQQSVVLGLQVPIMDWGRARSRLKIAEANLQLTGYSNQQSELVFNQEIRTEVSRFEMIRIQTSYTLQANLIAQEKYKISTGRYMVGQLGITDFIIATEDQTTSRRDYLLALRSFWTSFYKIQLLTQFDFVNKKKLSTELKQYN